MTLPPLRCRPLGQASEAGNDQVGQKPAPAGLGGVVLPSGFGGAQRSAVFSDGTGAYRYLLTRRWASGPALTWVMLNPSRADAESDDATIRRCLAFTRTAGYSAIHVVNLYAWRSHDPRAIRQAADPVGPDNDAWILAATQAVTGGAVVAAWGARADPRRVSAVVELLAGTHMHCLGVTAGGHPRHPLYVPASTPLQPLPATRPGAPRRGPGPSDPGKGRR